LHELAIRTTDEPMQPDQYRYIATHAWWIGSFSHRDAVHVHLSEHLLQQWTPAQPDRDWLLDREVTGRLTWLVGSGEEARAAGFDLFDAWPCGRFRAPHGDFYAQLHGAAPRRRSGGWTTPTPEFLARLPRDPDALRARLCEDSSPGRYTGPFSTGLDALRTCLVPADLRAVLYRVLLGLPAVRIREVTDVDGNPCLALVHDDGPTRTELLIDPVDGQFAGERDTLRRGSPCGLTAGTVISSTSVRTAVVDRIGALPGF
jgi:hypothetical protein